MKKINLLLILTFACSLFASAQVERELPDGSFENWETEKTFAGDDYDDLANPFWQTLNMLASLPPELSTGVVAVYKVEGRNGGFAPKMESVSMIIGDTTNIFVPGVVGALTVDLKEQTATFGRPYTSRPISLRGFMKYTPVNGDSASIFVKLYKEGRTIGMMEQKYTAEIVDWTKFELNVEYVSDDAPDSVSVLFVSSAGYNFDNLFACKGQVGSALWVDDCEFVFSDTPPLSNENKLLTSNIFVYPNPSTDYIKVDLNGATAKNIEIYDQTGRLVAKSLVYGNNPISISHLNTGFYTYRLLDKKNDVISVGKIIKK